MEETEKPDIGGIPKTLRDSFETINIFRPPKNPIIRKDSPAAEFLKKKSSEAEDIEEAKKKVEKETKSLLKLRDKISEIIKEDE